MKAELENGINSLIAYYFKMTRFKFLDEYDLRILVDLANVREIHLNVDDNAEEIFNQFLSKLDDQIDGAWHKGIVGRTDIFRMIYNSEKENVETVKRLQINDNFIQKCLTTYKEEELQIVDELISFLDKVVGSDMNVLISKMPNSDLLKKYMTLKKIVLCKPAFIGDFYKDIPSASYYNSFDDWSDNEQDRGIYPQTYEFLEKVEQAGTLKLVKK